VTRRDVLAQRLRPVAPVARGGPSSGGAPAAAFRLARDDAIVVTGGTGGVGRALVAWLIEVSRERRHASSRCAARRRTNERSPRLVTKPASHTRVVGLSRGRTHRVEARGVRGDRIVLVTRRALDGASAPPPGVRVAVVGDLADPAALAAHPTLAALRSVRRARARSHCPPRALCGR